VTRQKKGKRQNEVQWRDKPFSKSLAWLYLIRLARHKELNWSVKNRKFDLQRGQFYCRKSDLAKRWGWPDKKVRRFFKKLQGEGKITQESLEGIGTIIKIIDFDNVMGDFFA